MLLRGLVAALVISMLDMPIFAFRRKRLDWGCAGPIIPRDWRAPLDPIAIGVPQWPAIADRIPGIGLTAAMAGGSRRAAHEARSRYPHLDHGLAFPRCTTYHHAAERHWARLRGLFNRALAPH